MRGNYNHNCPNSSYPTLRTDPYVANRNDHATRATLDDSARRADASEVTPGEAEKLAQPPADNYNPASSEQFPRPGLSRDMRPRGGVWLSATTVATWHSTVPQRILSAD